MKSVVSFPLFAGLFLFGCSHKDNVKQEVYNVTTQNIEMVDQNECGTYIGTVEASVSSPLSFQTMGQVDEVNASEGQFVNKGQVLAVLDNHNATNSLRIAEAKEKQAQDAYKRLESIYKSGSLTEIKWVEMQSNLEQAQSMKQLALKSYNDCTLRAPFGGYIGKRNVEPGVSVIPGISAFTLVKIEKVYVTIPVPENEIAKIKKGQEAEITVAALDNEKFAGNVEDLGVVADIVSHTYTVKIAVTNRNLHLKPGMVANVYLESKSLVQYPIIPLKAVLTDENNKKYVFVARLNRTAIKKEVKLGKLLNQGVVITEGLDSTDVIIVEGNHKLIDNSPINIVNTSK